MVDVNRPVVYVIVLNWNNYEDTRNCIASLQAATYPALKILVVDNGSADQSGQLLQADFPDLRFIFNGKNLGFSKGCNAGISAALDDKECAYVLLLNNDSKVEPGFLEAAIDHAERDERVGLVGGKILHSPESKVIAYAGGFITRWRGQVIIRGFNEPDRGQYDQADEVGFITGAFMLIRRSVLEKIGLLPEEYFFGTEEQDYSFNVQRSGYKLLYVPGFVAYHRGDGSHWNWDPKFVYNGYRNKLIFQEKYLPPGVFPLWKIVFSIYARYAAQRSWKRMASRYGYDKGREVFYEDMKFALIRAIKDHGKNMLSEETLNQFEKSLKSRKNGATGKRDN
ncbi:MAG: glycosyltransferase family 2 protein [Blastocatellia bacterium]